MVDAAASFEAGALGFRELAERFRGLASAGPAMVARAAEVMDQEVTDATAEGRGVDGEPWAPRKTVTIHGRPRSDAGKGRVLARARQAVAVRAIGTVLTVTMTGPEVFHQFGAGGKPVRKVLPTKIDRLGNAIRLGVVSVSSEWLNAHRRGSYRATKSGGRTR